MKSMSVEEFQKTLREGTKKEVKLPILSHPDCGYASRAQVKLTKKNNFMWHCVICGETRFFQGLDVIECSHILEWKSCKNSYVTAWCPICRIRIFRRATKEADEKGGDMDEQ
jgi:hypothetical protein